MMLGRSFSNHRRSQSSTVFLFISVTWLQALVVYVLLLGSDFKTTKTFDPPTGTSEMLLDPDRRNSPDDMYSQFRNNETVFVRCHFLAPFKKGYWRWTLSCEDYFDIEGASSNWPVDATEPHNSVESVCSLDKSCTFSYNSQISFAFKSVLEMCLLSCFLVDPLFNKTITLSSEQVDGLLYSSTVFLHSEIMSNASDLDVHLLFQRKNEPKPDQDNSSALSALIYAAIGFITISGIMLVGVRYIKKSSNQSDSAQWALQDSDTAMRRRYLVLNSGRESHPSLLYQTLGTPHFSLANDGNWNSFISFTPTKLAMKAE